MADNLVVLDGNAAPQTRRMVDIGGGVLAEVAILAGKTGVLVDEANPVPVSSVLPATAPYGAGTREYGTPARNAVAAASVAFALPALGASREIYVQATTRLYFITGTGTLTVAPASAHSLEAGERFHFRVPAGHDKIAVIRDSADGTFTMAAAV